MAARVFASIVHWNAPARAERCLRSVLASAGVDMDVLVVDNASSPENYRELVARVGAGRVLRLPANRGCAGGRNAAIEEGMKRGGYPVFLFLTHDVVLAEEAVANLVQALETDARVGVAGPLVYWLQAPDRMYSAGGYLDRRRAVTGTLPGPRGSTPYAVDWVDGCCIAVRREVLEKAGVFDERYFMYFEETDLCQRAHRAGWSVVVVPAARVWHEASPAPGAHWHYYMVRNGYLFWQEHFGMGFAHVAWPYLRSLLDSSWGLAKGLVKSILFPSPSTWEETRRRARITRDKLSGWLQGSADHRAQRYGPAPGRRVS